MSTGAQISRSRAGKQPSRKAWELFRSATEALLFAKRGATPESIEQYARRHSLDPAKRAKLEQSRHAELEHYQKQFRQIVSKYPQFQAAAQKTEQLPVQHDTDVSAWMNGLSSDKATNDFDEAVVAGLADHIPKGMGTWEIRRPKLKPVSNQNLMRFYKSVDKAKRRPWANVAIELAERFGTSIWELQGALFSLRSHARAEQKFWEGLREGANQQKVLNLKGRHMTKQRAAALRSVSLAVHGPPRDERRKRAGKLLFRGDRDKRDWRRHDPVTLRMIVDVWKVLKKSIPTQREQIHATIRVIDVWYITNGLSSPQLNYKVVHDQIRYQARKRRKR